MQLYIFAFSIHIIFLRITYFHYIVFSFLWNGVIGGRVNQRALTCRNQPRILYVRKLCHSLYDFVLHGV